MRNAAQKFEHAVRTSGAGSASPTASAAPRAGCSQPALRGEYQQVENSAAFPFLHIADLVPFLQPDEQVDETTHLRRFIEWVREQKFEV